MATTQPARAACHVVDLVPDYFETVDRIAREPPDQQAPDFRKLFVARHPGLFEPDVLGLDPGRLNDAVARAVAETERNAIAQRQATARMRGLLALHLRKFAATFSDFDCGFAIYLSDTLGQFDGAARIVDGAPALVLGVDVIARAGRGSEMPVFVDHELFHRYHFQAAGFSDDPGEHQAIWRTLWAEGMATYVSRRLNPAASEADAFLLPRDLAWQCAPQLPRLARDLLGGFDRLDSVLYAQYFEYGTKAATDAGTPFRAVYYVGYRVAERLARGRSLRTLAHLKGPSLESEIRAALEAFARGE